MKLLANHDQSFNNGFFPPPYLFRSLADRWGTTVDFPPGNQKRLLHVLNNVYFWLCVLSVDKNKSMWRFTGKEHQAIDLL